MFITELDIVMEILGCQMSSPVRFVNVKKVLSAAADETPVRWNAPMGLSLGTAAVRLVQVISDSMAIFKTTRAPICQLKYSVHIRGFFYSYL